MCGHVPHVPGPTKEKIQVAEQSVAARLRLSASHVCTWALLMQEDCLAMWMLFYRGLLHPSPLRPRMASGCVELSAQARVLPISTVVALRTDTRRQGGNMLLRVSAE